MLHPPLSLCYCVVTFYTFQYAIYYNKDILKSQLCKLIVLGFLGRTKKSALLKGDFFLRPKNPHVPKITQNPI